MILARNHIWEAISTYSDENGNGTIDFTTREGTENAKFYERHKADTFYFDYETFSATLCEKSYEDHRADAPNSVCHIVFYKDHRADAPKSD